MSPVVAYPNSTGAAGHGAGLARWHDRGGAVT